MSDVDLAAVVDRIAKLRRLAEDPGATEAERRSAFAQAARLIERHRLSEAEIERGAPATTDPVWKSPSVARGKTIEPWRLMLLNALAEHHGLVTLRTRVVDTGEVALQLVGRKGDIELARSLYAILELEAKRQCRDEARRTKLRSKAQWLRGFAIGINAQLKEARQVARAEATSTALAVLDKRRQDAMDALGDVPMASIRRSEPSDDTLRGFTKGKAHHLGKSLEDK